MSASNFDGQHLNGDEVITGSATGRTQDSMGNAVVSTGTIDVVNDGVHSAYFFDSNNSIKTTTSVGSDFTFVSVFRRKLIEHDGRCFTGTGGNYFFTCEYGGVNSFYLDSAYLTDANKRITNTEIQFFIGTNNAGTKNMWNIKLNQAEFAPTTGGANAWGQTVIGKPAAVGGAANFYVYEDLVFDHTLNTEQMEYIKTEFKKKYLA